jgi:hypothetical protein
MFMNAHPLLPRSTPLTCALMKKTLVSLRVKTTIFVAVRIKLFLILLEGLSGGWGGGAS